MACLDQGFTAHGGYDQLQHLMRARYLVHRGPSVAGVRGTKCQLATARVRQINEFWGLSMFCGH